MNDILQYSLIYLAGFLSCFTIVLFRLMSDRTNPPPMRKPNDGRWRSEGGDGTCHREGGEG